MQAFQDLLRTKPLGRAEIEAFLRGRTVPMVDGRRVTFLFHGRADAVRLRHFIFGLPTSEPFHRVEKTDLWHLTLEIPPGSRIEYKIEREVGGKNDWIMDPLNPNIARDPFGANSVCHGEGYETPEWTRRDPDSREGRIEEFRIKTRDFGDEYSVGVYLPARFRPRRTYPLLVVHDGEDYLRYSALKAVLDNLIDRIEIAPMIVALTRPVDRLKDYAADPRHARLLTEELVPALESNYPLVGEPKARALLGASLGGIASLHTAWTHPGFYGRLLLQSTSFAFSDIGGHDRGPVFDPVAEFVNEFRERPGRPTERMFLSCGMYESLIYENRSMVPLLQSIGMDLRYVEARDGHNWENWRDRLREGLSWLFPGPLWMVYE